MRQSDHLADAEHCWSNDLSNTIEKMGYRIQFFREDFKMGDIPSEKSLPDAREQAIETMPLFKADYALVIDEHGKLIDRFKRSA